MTEYLTQSHTTHGAGEIRCSGGWVLSQARELETALTRFDWPEGDLVIDAAAVDAMDTAGAWLLFRTLRGLERKGRGVTLRGLKREFASLMAMIEARGAEAAVIKPQNLKWLARLGCNSLSHLEQVIEMLAFIGEAAMAGLRMLRQPSRIRLRPVLHNIQGAGFDALPIVGLLSFLMGVVVSYQGAEQLARYGASIFVADLVGLSMLREMSPLLTATLVFGVIDPLLPAEGLTVQVGMFAEQFAVVPPFAPEQLQVHGPVPVTELAVPCVQRLVAGAAVKV